MLPNSRQGRKALEAVGFTLVEILVAMVVLVLIMALLLSMLNQTTSMWRSTMGNVQEFQRAREAFEILTTRLSRATLNTYWGYNTASTPETYYRESELRFLCGPCSTLVGTGASSAPTYPGQAVFFQAPGGVPVSGTVSDLPGSLSTWGYYVAYGNDTNYRPSVLSGLPTRYRFRLFEMMEPSDQLTIYKYTSGVQNLSYTATTWFTPDLSLGATRMRVLAENVVALIVLPKLSAGDDASGVQLAPFYAYDSTATSVATPSPVVTPAASAGMLDPKNQLPPIVQVIMVVVEGKRPCRMGRDAAESRHDHALSKCRQSTRRPEYA